MKAFLHPTSSLQILTVKQNKDGWFFREVKLMEDFFFPQKKI